MADLIRVRFLKHHQSYNPGELAGFLPHIARELLGVGVAEEVVDEVAEEVALPADPADRPDPAVTDRDVSVVTKPATAPDVRKRRIRKKVS